ncbi:hypothetical protein TrLO_g15340 [Triparma laevis f. longispina]|uniref:Uncharacterized protein n=1 Tax=Triparma laevis f. longispina TaxID=1714387 RepID=A0A9W7KSQ0_9STRA|nr:hypothetical protein TrLO_g15340 [Triparma laevis f. longispina]
MSSLMVSASDPITYIIPAALITTIGLAYTTGSTSGGQKPSNHARKQLKNKKKGLSHKEEPSGRLSLGELDVRRKCQIAIGGPTDHSGEVIVSAVPGFDLNSTIFGSVTGVLPRTVQKSKVAIELFWSDSAVRRVEKLFSPVPSPPSYKSQILDFMNDECDFAIEHADGSFMDHLKFCHDYSVHNYSTVSPLPMLLHSIMGVGTNFFPMKVDQIGRLKEMVSPQEFTHIEAFPSFLRLVLGTDFLEVIKSRKNELHKLKGLNCNRVIDNTPLSLNGEDFWTQMNYQLLHMLDFLPAASWLSQLDDGFMWAFIQLHEILSDSGRLACKVDFDLSSGESTPDGMPLTVGSILRGVIPDFIIKKLAQKAIGKFSKAIKHDLAYELIWE